MIRKWMQGFKQELQSFKACRTKTKLKLVLVGLAGMGILSFGSVVMLKILFLQGVQPHQPPLAQEGLSEDELGTENVDAEGEKTAKKKGEEEQFTIVYEIRNVSIPLVDRRATRVANAQFTLLLDCKNESARRAMELNRAKLLDLIYEVASQFYIEDFDSREGIVGFKERLRTAYKKHFQNDAPRDLVLKEWFVG